MNISPELLAFVNRITDEHLRYEWMMVLRDTHPVENCPCFVCTLVMAGERKLRRTFMFGMRFNCGVVGFTLGFLLGGLL